MKIYDDVILHVFADWALPSIKNPGYAFARIQEIIMLGYFPFQLFKKAMQSSNRGQDIFEDFKGFEAKAKDLCFDAKAKDLTMCSRGRSQAKDVLENSTSDNIRLVYILEIKLKFL